MLRCHSTLALFITSLTLSAQATELEVGPGQKYARIEDALARAAHDDTILVHPQAGGKPYDKVALYVTKERITIRAVPDKPGGRVTLSGAGFDYSGEGSVPRAIIQFNPGSDGGSLTGFELLGAHNASHNGAGVRINQANDVTIRSCHIHDNDMGIMSGGTLESGLRQWIEGCLIESNGDKTDPGQNHNLYLGGASVTLSACEVRGSLTGHNVKSRAHQTNVLWCYVHDSCAREFDFVDEKGVTSVPDSNALLIGNVIVKSPSAEGNKQVIHFGQDGGTEHDGAIILINNTIVTPHVTAVVTLSSPRAKARLQNNILWSAGSKQAGQRLVDVEKAAAKDAVSGASNWLSAGFGGAELAALPLLNTHLAAHGQDPPFVDAARGDFRLARQDDSILGAGQAIDAATLKLVGGRLYQYKAPQSKEDRPSVAHPSLGAYEPLAKGR